MRWTLQLPRMFLVWEGTNLDTCKVGRRERGTRYDFPTLIMNDEINNEINDEGNFRSLIFMKHLFL